MRDDVGALLELGNGLNARVPESCRGISGGIGQREDRTPCPQVLVEFGGDLMVAVGGLEQE